MSEETDAPKTRVISFRVPYDDKNLASRTDTNKTAEWSQIAARDLRRYYYTLRITLSQIQLTEAEALLICDVQNGTLVEPYSASFLWANVADGIKLDSMDQKWQEVDPNLDGAALVEKLKALTPFEALAISDAVERWWNIASGSDRPHAEMLREVGLLRPESQLQP